MRYRAIKKFLSNLEQVKRSKLPSNVKQKLLGEMNLLVKSLKKSGGERWITIHPHGKGYVKEGTGEGDYRHVKIDESGNIVGGSIPKDLQGQNIREAFRKGKKPQPFLSRHLADRGLKHQLFTTESGKHYYQIGEGLQLGTDKWGRETAKQGTVQFQKPQLKPKFGKGTWVHVYSNFNDKDKLKSMGARYDGDVKAWYIPLKDVPNVAHKFSHATIHSRVVQAYEEELGQNPEASSKKEVVIQTKDGEKKFEAKSVPAWSGKMPTGMEHVNLYQHQKAGVEFLLHNKKAILGMAVGLGKTPTAITAANVAIEEGKTKRFGVIAPSSVKYQWKSEIEKFSNKKAVVLDSSMSKKKLEQAFEDAKNADFVIANYEMLRNVGYAERLKELTGDAVIADEGHKIKNITSQQTKAFSETYKDAKYKWLLTATPFPNGQPRETHTMLSHATPKAGSWSNFAGKYAVMQAVSTPRGKIMKPVSLKNHEKLKEEMKDAVFLRTHNSPDVNSSLPSARHITHSIEMNKVQAKIYNAMRDDLMHELDDMSEDQYKQNAANVLTKMKRLEQIAVDPDQLDPEKADMSKLYPKEQWTVDTVMDHLEDKANKGIVIFSDSKMPLEKVKSGLIKQGLSSSEIGIISGDISPVKRKEVQDRFSEGKVKVVLSTSAGEEGVNLQHGGHTLIHMDTPWVPKSITQREGRVHRIGQGEHTTFYSPTMADTIESTKRGKLASKIADIEKLLGEGAAGSASENIAATAKAWNLKDMKEMLGALPKGEAKKSLSKKCLQAKNKLNKALSSDPRVEQLAEAIHNIWMGWSVHAAERVNKETRKRWEKMWISYDELPELEKEKDRVEARALLDAVKQNKSKKSLPPLAEDRYLKDSQYCREYRSNYFAKSGAKIASSRTAPAKENIPPIGTWKIDDNYVGPYGREIEQLRVLNPNNVLTNEITGPERMLDVERYAKWRKSGMVPPPISVVETEDGKLRAVDGHRRRLAAIKSKSGVLAWVNPIAPSWELDKSGRPIMTGLTYEMMIKSSTPFIDGKFPLIAAIDFDGTIHDGQYPEEGNPKLGVKEALTWYKENGGTIILWTCREGGHLKRALGWMKRHDIPHDYVNKNVPDLDFDTGRKIYADVYIDNRGYFPGWKKVLGKLKELKGGEQVPAVRKFLEQALSDEYEAIHLYKRILKDKDLDNDERQTIKNILADEDRHAEILVDMLEGMEKARSKKQWEEVKDRKEKEYSHVDKFADPEHDSYPIDTPEHVRAAWSYINRNRNANKYAEDKLSKVKAKIKQAAKKFGIKITG